MIDVYSQNDKDLFLTRSLPPLVKNVVLNRFSLKTGKKYVFIAKIYN